MAGFFYENILKWLKDETGRVGDVRDQIRWLYLVRKAVEELLNNLEEVNKWLE